MLNSQGLGISLTGTSIWVGPPMVAKPWRSAARNSPPVRSRESPRAPTLPANFATSGLRKSLAITRPPSFCFWKRRTLP